MPDEEDAALTAEQVAALRDRPARSVGDGATLEERSADDIIKLDQYARAKTAGIGIRMRKLVPDGTT